MFYFKSNALITRPFINIKSWLLIKTRQNKRINPVKYIFNETTDKDKERGPS